MTVAVRWVMPQYKQLAILVWSLLRYCLFINLCFTAVWEYTGVQYCYRQAMYGSSLVKNLRIFFAYGFSKHTH